MERKPFRKRSFFFHRNEKCILHRNHGCRDRSPQLPFFLLTPNRRASKGASSRGERMTTIFMILPLFLAIGHGKACPSERPSLSQREKMPSFSLYAKGSAGVRGQYRSSYTPPAINSRIREVFGTSKGESGAIRASARSITER